jgi:23S rRNA A2030 N6-methylase RlmJ
MFIVWFPLSGGTKSLTLARSHTGTLVRKRVKIRELVRPVRERAKLVSVGTYIVCSNQVNRCVRSRLTLFCKGVMFIHE